MKTCQYVPDYRSKLDLRQTQQAIKVIKDTFQTLLAQGLHLERVTAPVLVTGSSGINDDLNGVERKVDFTIKSMDEEKAEVVQSLAKWKRVALKRYGFQAGEGLYTDMNAIRRDDDMDNTHSIFVDQWDWEAVITAEQRTVEHLKETVRRIVKAIADTNRLLQQKYPLLTTRIAEDVCFITAQELEDRYPAMSGKEREDAITREYGTVFLMQIGHKLKSGRPHDGRAPDYDDWNLNGDLLLWDDVRSHALEISSMGIRVDAAALEQQLALAGAQDRMRFPYHQGVANGTLPLTIGGGIGQSRLCMLLLQKAHVGEVQVSVWPRTMIEECAAHGITLL
ncbi:MAG: aspartate--ammonia ligase [Clostridia bacterium]|nr:aspartate--ammonia ligase [Clostridia bacterium]